MTVTVAEQLTDMFERLQEFTAEMIVALGELGPLHVHVFEVPGKRGELWGLIADIAVRRGLTTEADIRRVYFDDEVGEWFIQQHNWRRIMVPAG